MGGFLSIYTDFYVFVTLKFDFFSFFQKKPELKKAQVEKFFFQFNLFKLKAQTHTHIICGGF